MFRISSVLRRIGDLNDGDLWFDPVWGTLWKMTRDRGIDIDGNVVFWCEWSKGDGIPRPRTWFKSERLVQRVVEEPD